MLYSNCHLGLFPTSVSKLEYVIITGRLRSCSAPTSLSIEPSQFPLAFCTTVLMGPKAMSINKTSLLLFSQGDNSQQLSKLQIKPPCWCGNLHRPCFPLTALYTYRSILLLYTNPYSFFGRVTIPTTSSDNELIKCTTLLVNFNSTIRPAAKGREQGN